MSDNITVSSQEPGPPRMDGTGSKQNLGPRGSQPTHPTMWTLPSRGLLCASRCDGHPHASYFS